VQSLSPVTSNGKAILQINRVTKEVKGRKVEFVPVRISSGFLLLESRVFPAATLRK